MGQTLSFRKYHGNGNDFVVLDGLDGALPVELLEQPAVATTLCQRHTGIGADGLLLVLPPQSPTAHARMRVINSDGSEAEMCGNGIRCVAKAMHDHMGRFGELSRLLLDTGAGLLACELNLDPRGLVRTVRVDMGRPELLRELIPMEGQGTLVEAAIQIQGRELQSTAVSMGNPHLVSFVDPSSGQDPRQLAETLGPLLEHHEWFPNRTNVEFARPREDGSLELWVWERGCGLTLACGTGACATAVAAQVTGRHAAKTPLTMHLPGGPLTIVVAEDLSRVWMEGPAEEVYSGVVQI